MTKVYLCWEDENLESDFLFELRALKLARNIKENKVSGEGRDQGKRKKFLKVKKFNTYLLTYFKKIYYIRFDKSLSLLGR